MQCRKWDDTGIRQCSKSKMIPTNNNHCSRLHSQQKRQSINKGNKFQWDFLIIWLH